MMYDVENLAAWPGTVICLPAVIARVAAAARGARGARGEHRCRRRKVGLLLVQQRGANTLAQIADKICTPFLGQQQ